MKESLGNSMVFTLIMVFTAVFIVTTFSALVFSKGFKIRNRIIDIVESHGEYNDEAAAEIDENLRAIGYQIVETECGKHNGVDPLETKSVFPYCIYEYSSINTLPSKDDGTKGTTSRGSYYGVKVFIRIDIPLLNTFVKLPLYGETRVIFDKERIEG